MSRFRFRLDSLLRLRQYQRDLCQQELARKLAESEQLLNQRQRLERQREQVLRELRQLQQARVVKVERAAARRYYAGQVLAAILNVEQQRQRVLREVEQKRRELAEAEKRVQVLEKLKEKKLAEHVYETNRREGLQLEDAWSAAELGRSVP